MTDQPYGEQSLPFDRSELFALGAAAGAVVTAAVAAYLERRQPQTAWEKAQAQGAEALSKLSGTSAGLTQRLQGRTNTKSRWWKQTKKATAKQRKGGRRSAGRGGFAAGLFGTAAADTSRKKARTAAARAAERLVGDPYAVSGSLEETLKEQLGNLRGASGSARTYGGKLAHQAQDYAAAAQRSLRDAHLGEKARQYGDVLAHQAQDYAAVAQRSLQDAHLGERARQYGEALAGFSAETSKATRKAAQTGVSKVAQGASTIAEVTGEQMQDLRKSARKSAKRTRRRVSWGLRAFALGLAFGLLAAPQSGQRTRDLLTSFVQDLLDVIMPDNQL